MKGKPTVLLTRRLFGSAEAILRSKLRVLAPRRVRMSRAEIRRGLERADGLLCQLTDSIDARLLDSAPRLRAVSVCAVGYENVDLEACRSRGILVSHTPGVLTEASADHTMALLLAAARRVVEGDRRCRTGRFGRWDLEYMLGKQVSGSTLGIVGMGRIGRAVARRARGFGMKVLHTSRRGGPAGGRSGSRGRRTGLVSLLAAGDFVSIHVPGGERTHHLIGRRELARMKPGAILINTSRGSVVDTRALIRALRSGRLAGAALDVFEDEPEVSPGLAGLPGVVLTPHVASATLETRTAMAELAATNMVEMLAGRPARAKLVRR